MADTPKTSPDLLTAAQTAVESYFGDRMSIEGRMQALRAALEQPTPEPGSVDESLALLGDVRIVSGDLREHVRRLIDAYTAQAQRLAALEQPPAQRFRDAARGSESGEVGQPGPAGAPSERHIVGWLRTNAAAVGRFAERYIDGTAPPPEPMRAGYSPVCLATGADELRRAVRAMAAMLGNGEWAEHVSSDPDAQALEAAITDLHSDHRDAYDTLTEAGWRRDNGDWALSGPTGAPSLREDVARAGAYLDGMKHASNILCVGPLLRDRAVQMLNAEIARLSADISEGKKELLAGPTGASTPQPVAEYLQFVSAVSAAYRQGLTEGYSLGMTGNQHELEARQRIAAMGLESAAPGGAGEPK